jgi:hypothetical protein
MPANEVCKRADPVLDVQTFGSTAAQAESKYGLRVAQSESWSRFEAIAKENVELLAKSHAFAAKQTELKKVSG